MPSTKLSPRLTAWLIAVAVAGCSALGGSLPTSAEFARLPREIRTGAADTVIEPVERDVSADEVNSAVSRIVSASPVCITWPSLWIEDQPTRNIYRARFDLMRRDWGVPVAAASEQRMDEFVDMGFLTKRPRDDIGPGVAEYTLTDLGRGYLTGSPYGGDRPTFCAPSERRVVAVTHMDFGQFPCGTLQVHFMHAAPDGPSWARTDAARMRVAQSTDAPPQGEGVITLGREWYRPDVLPEGLTNGSLNSACYDSGHKNIIGNDLNLNAGSGS
ncbi:MAG: hypothetical protein QM759_01880 [Terricaulis sp.]